jgi:hypothetical protein
LACSNASILFLFVALSDKPEVKLKLYDDGLIKDLKIVNNQLVEAIKLRKELSRNEPSFIGGLFG